MNFAFTRFGNVSLNIFVKKFSNLTNLNFFVKIYILEIFALLFGCIDLDNLFLLYHSMQID